MDVCACRVGSCFPFPFKPPTLIVALLAQAGGRRNGMGRSLHGVYLLLETRQGDRTSRKGRTQHRAGDRVSATGLGGRKKGAGLQEAAESSSADGHATAPASSDLFQLYPGAEDPGVQACTAADRSAHRYESVARCGCPMIRRSDHAIELEAGEREREAKNGGKVGRGVRRGVGAESRAGGAIG